MTVDVQNADDFCVEEIEDFEALLGAEASEVLDRPLCITQFADDVATAKVESRISLRDFARAVLNPIHRQKSDLPWLKLASFGTQASDKGCLRTNDNVVAVEGVEFDYDGGDVPIERAVELLRANNVAGLVYPSPSWCVQKQKWRALIPFSAPLRPSEREQFAAWIFGMFDRGGARGDGASFVLSQAHYYGRVAGRDYPDPVLVTGRPVDQATELADGAMARDGRPWAARDELPEIDHAVISANDEREIRRLKSALAAIPATDADEAGGTGYDLWREIGMALHHASGGAGWAMMLWDEWSQLGEKYDSRKLKGAWRSFGRSKSNRKITVASLYKQARDRDWDDPIMAEELAAEFDDLPELTDAFDSTFGDKPRLTFLSPSDCATSEHRRYVVKGLVAERDVGCIFGAPGAGKSLISPFLGYSVAQGSSAFGMRTRQGRVFYVAAEDPYGMRARVQSLRIKHGDANAFTLVEGVSDLLSAGSSDLRELQKAVDAQRPALIFIDTLAMAFPGLEENSADAMGEVVKVARSLTEHGAAVVLIHHDTKANGGTPRGHSLLNGALDVALQLTARDSDGIIRGKLTKNRNGSCDRDIAFVIALEALGIDEDGDSISAARAEPLPVYMAPAAEKLTPSERAALEILQSIANGDRVVEADWRMACVRSRTVSAAEAEASRYKAFKRAFEGLARKGRVDVANGLIGVVQAYLGNAFEEAFDEVDA